MNSFNNLLVLVLTAFVTVNFVSSKLQAEDTGLPAAEVSQELRLGAWNLKKLGHGSSKDYTTVAAVIDSHFDVLAVVEVMQKGGGHPGYDALMIELAPHWTR